MKKIISLALFAALILPAIAQQTDVKKLVQEGIALHDKGDYEAAIKKYDEALKLNPEDFDAAYEKSMTCLYAKRYNDCIALSKTLIEKFPGNPTLKQAYSNWGSALDDEGKPEEALKVYDNGLAAFPDHYLLHFNKGLTYARLKKYNEAAACYKSALQLNPLHASSNYQLGSLYQKSNRIASLLAYLTFVVCEPQSERSKQAYDAVQEIVYRNISKDGKNTTITLSPDFLNRSEKKQMPDDFSTAELMFSLVGSMDNAKGMDSLAKTAAGKFDFKLQMLIGSLSEGAKQHSGFFWEHYVPFFSDLKKEGYTGVLSNLLYFSKDAGAQSWMESNREKVDAFYKWWQSRSW